MNTGIVIPFPGSAPPPRELTKTERSAVLARTLAETMRDYRNLHGLDEARAAIFAQMYVLGIIDSPNLAVAAFAAIGALPTINGSEKDPSP